MNTQQHNALHVDTRIFIGELIEYINTYELNASPDAIGSQYSNDNNDISLMQYIQEKVKEYYIEYIGRCADELDNLDDAGIVSKNLYMYADEVKQIDDIVKYIYDASMTDE